MKISELLENVSSIVYHYTSLDSAMKILSEKRFKLVPALGTDSEEKLGTHKFYYMSTARGKTADYTLHNVYKVGVTFVLNGDWFNQRYVGKPVDYWERMWLRSREAGSKDRYSEMEDRIFSDEPYINMKNMSDAILAVHVLYEETEPSHRLKNIVSTCLKNKIPVYLYDDKDAFILQNKRKSIPIKEFFGKFSFKQPAGYTRIAKDWLEPYKELYYKKSKSELSKDGERARYKVMYYQHDAIIGLSADIHNMKKTDTDKVKGFIDIMKKGKFKTVKDFIEKMHDKWMNMNEED